MKILVFLPLLLAASYGSPLGRVQDPYARGIYDARINKGIWKSSLTDDLKKDLKALLKGQAALADCPDFEPLRQYSRREEYQISINCNGNMRWAYFVSDEIKRIDDLAAAPPLNVPGAFSKEHNLIQSPNFEDLVFPWVESVTPDGCVANYKDSAARSLPGTTVWTTPIVCKDKTQWVQFQANLTGGFIQPQSVDEKPKMRGLEKMCLMNMKKILVSSEQINTRAILNDAQLTSEVAALKIDDGSYLELKPSWGTQYCILARDEDAMDKQAVLSMYQFDLETTEPFMATLPFNDMATCEWFLKKTANSWIKPNAYILN